MDRAVKRIMLAGVGGQGILLHQGFSAPVCSKRVLM